MQVLAEYVSTDPYSKGVKTTVSENKEKTVVEICDKTIHAKDIVTTITFRNVPRNKTSTLQFQVETRKTDGRGKFISFSIPGDLVELFLDRLAVTYQPPQ